MDASGGKVKSHESFESAIKREVKEETGLEIDILNLLTITKPVDSKNDTRWFSPVFLVKIKSGEPQNLEPESHQELQWIPLTSLPQKMNTTTKLAVNEFMVLYQKT